MEDKIINYKKEEDEIENFRSTLIDFYQKTGKKTLFIIDELDRSRPDFSLDLLEKIKNLFRAC
ncbi:P-loop NTPase fold protein [Xenorhabdus ishibashii]|uniref:P-loop NTPase fold protein n=1 Tax=Xenorhabdus ishibashii TaxID=1034471 RepID=UPI0011455C8C